MLRLWNYKKVSDCPLCGADRCTLHHILVGCSTALEQKRYIWRHDSVLSNIAVALQSHVQQLNQSAPSSTKPPHISRSFYSHHILAQADPSDLSRKPVGSRKKSAKGHCKSANNGPSLSLLHAARDWRLIDDVGKKRLLFPPEIYATPLRPDCVIWSKTAKTVILVELTCPAEEGITAANIRKSARYDPLVASITDDTDWTALCFPIEIGARGLVGRSTRKFFRKVGFTNQLATRVCKTLSVVVARCSYAIYLAHSSHNWDRERELITELEVPDTESPTSVHEDATAAAAASAAEDAAPAPPPDASDRPIPVDGPSPTLKCLRASPRQLARDRQFPSGHRSAKAECNALCSCPRPQRPPRAHKVRKRDQRILSMLNTMPETSAVLHPERPNAQRVSLTPSAQVSGARRRRKDRPYDPSATLRLSSNRLPSINFKALREFVPVRDRPPEA